MKHMISVVTAALVSIAAASSVHRRHKELHLGRDGNVVLVTDWEIETVTDWETAWNLQSSQEVSRPDRASHTASVVHAVTSLKLDPTFAPLISLGDQSDELDNGDKQLGSDHALSVQTASLTTQDAISADAELATQSAAAASPQQTRVSVSEQRTDKSASIAPNGRKAGLSGYVGIQNLDAFSELAPHISWYSDYTPSPPTTDNVTGVGMLWGANGSPCGVEVTSRLAQFKKAVAQNTPRYMFGFYEPDCYCADSSEMSASSGTTQWNQLIAPLGKKGTVLGSPSMCKQKDEDWLQPFTEGGLDHDWHVTSVHINKPDLQGIKEDIEYYASTYKKPIWVSEFACVHDKGGWQPCTDQNEINQFIHEAVNFFQNNSTVVAYGPSNGNGLGNIWPLTDAEGKLTASGRTYLHAIQNL